MKRCTVEHLHFTR